MTKETPGQTNTEQTPKPWSRRDLIMMLSGAVIGATVGTLSTLAGVKQEIKEHINAQLPPQTTPPTPKATPDTVQDPIDVTPTAPDAEETEETTKGLKEEINPDEVQYIESCVEPHFKPMLENLVLTPEGKLTAESEKKLRENLAKKLSYAQMTGRDLGQPMPESIDFEANDLVWKDVTFNGRESLSGGITIIVPEDKKAVGLFFGDIQLFQLNTLHIQGNTPDGNFDHYNFQAQIFGAEENPETIESVSSVQITPNPLKTNNPVGLIQETHQIGNWSQQRWSGEPQDPKFKMLRDYIIECKDVSEYQGPEKGIIIMKTRKRNDTEFPVKNPKGAFTSQRPENFSISARRGNNIFYVDKEAQDTVNQYAKLQ
ncbi:hypothetical protein M0P48_02195 [Candidatus Gracilibacteria bacterium]|nr:hypothetical protein [Candidatus Gracilibacteria bacterium]